MHETLDTGVVRELVVRDRPEFADLPLRHNATGWDNQTWRLGDELTVRLPMSRHAAQAIRVEARWLPEIARRSPLPVPETLHLGEPSARFPQAWTIARWVPGEPVDRSPLTDEGSADDLAEFLRTLHRPAPTDAPTGRGRGGDLAGFEEGFEQRLTRVRELVDESAARQVWTAARRAGPWSAGPVWLHADLHPANVVGRAGRLAGVLDFGDLCAGDPAADVAAAWLLLPTAGAVRRFLGHVTDDDLVARARGWALWHGLGLIGIGIDGELGHRGGQRTWRSGGTRALELLLH